MGIGFSHGDAHWSYNGFSCFRKRLAKEIGFDLDSMCGFRGTTPWNTIKDDIVPLLNHSDCDGHLTVAQCKKVAPRLKELVVDWPDGNYDKREALELVKGMEEAIELGESLRFQ